MKYLKLFEDYVETLFEGVWVENKTSKNVYYVKKFNPDTQIKASKEQIEKVKAGDDPTKKSVVTSQKKKLDEISNILKDSDEGVQERGKLLQKYWGEFLDAKTEEEKVEAVYNLVDNGLIEGSPGGKKIYVSRNIPGLNRKHLTGDSGNSTTMEMNKIIQKHEIPLEMRDTSSVSSLADRSGKHNESGVVAYLFGNEENKKNYEENRKILKELGGDDAKADEINKKAANEIKKALPAGAEIIGAQQVGGAGENALKEMGIEPKTDPTDILVTYKDKDGKTHQMKISAKIYDNPSSITMKNSGMAKAGSFYLGSIGDDIDKLQEELKSKYDWRKAKTEEEKDLMKKNYKEKYLEAYSKKMEELAKTPEGQDQLEKMWKSVHGCGKNVWTQVANKKTGEVELHPPDHYCKPQKPFKVKFHGTRLSIEMGGKSNSYLDLVVKTEEKGGKLLFNHKKRKKEGNDD